jgi:hypothetical protein
MPTVRPRHAITETDDIARALDDAARRWPELAGQRSRLLLRLVEEGHRAVVRADIVWTEQRIQVVMETSGCLSGVFGEGYLDGLRDEWPA